MTFTLCRAVSIATLVTVIGAAMPAHAQAPTVDTRIGPIPLQFGLPADAATVGKLYDEMDFQRASQVYLWALPIVGFAGWQDAQNRVFGGSDTDMVLYDGVKDKLGILTANNTTPYIIGLPDLSKTGPLVVDYPAGPTAGAIGDFWQRPLTDMGEAGPDKGKGAKYLIVGPGQDDPKDAGYTVIRSPTNNISLGFRVLEPDPAKATVLAAKFQLYPYANRQSPQPIKLVRPGGKPWSQTPPEGIAYWQRLDNIIQREPVLEQDRFYMAMLKPLGIEKGKPFKPDARQTKILVDGAQLGQLMAQSLAFANRDPNARYRPDARWEYLINFDPGQDVGSFAPLDERATYFYQAVATTRGMVTKTPGVGQAYLSSSRDKDGAWLDGSKTYKLHVPANVPAKQFWSLTVYDAATRAFIDNSKDDIVDRSSRGDLIKNADSSVDLYVGPTAPAGYEKNWIPSVPGKAWFALFRFYGPLEPYLDRSFALPDFAVVAATEGKTR